MRSAAIALLACASVIAGTPEEILRGIRGGVAQNLERLPNYTCRETVERFARPAAEKKLEKVDTVRLEVALIGRRELYAWPGSAKFEEKSIEKLVTGAGAIESGLFAMHLRNLFLKPGAEFTWRGETELEGRNAFRFDFEIGRERSEFMLRDGRNGAVVAYRGSFWADPATFDLLRLEIYVDEVPPPVQIEKAATAITYARFRLGDSDFLLPRSAEMRMTSPSIETLNRTHFDECRQYVGESVVTFGDTAAAEIPKPVRTVELPSGTTVQMSLETPIECRSAAIGDPLNAVLASAVKGPDRAVLLPKGARFSGRVTRIERRRRTATLEYCVVGVTFDSVETEGVRAAFAGWLRDAGVNTSMNAAYHVPFSRYRGTAINIWSNIPPQTAPPQPNEGVFYIRSTTQRTPRGFRLVWVTGE